MNLPLMRSGARLSATLLLSFTALFACSSSKIIISGQIINPTGLPIAQAEVSTEPPTDLTTTNKDGYFYITRQVVNAQGAERAIEPGVYQIRVSKEGFVPITIQVNALKGKVWVNSHTLQPDRAMINTIAPEATEEGEDLPSGGGGMMGM